MRIRTLVALCAVTALLGACAQPEATPVPEEGQGADPQVVQEAPEPLPLTSPAPAATDDAEVAGTADGPDAGPSASPSPAAASPAPSSGASPAPSVAPSPASSPTPAASSPLPAGEATPVTLLALADRTGDAGLRVDDHGDMVGFEMVSIGQDISVTVRFDGPIPAVLDDGEVQGVGIDLLEDADGESQYQLFAIGNADGWKAYLETPAGFVAYPGTFTIAGATLTMRVPWNTVGSPTRGPVRVFVDWAAPGLVLNDAGEDTLDGEPHTFDRNP